ncbi:3-oxoacyl-[acyl-carrier-protein] reductase FabG [Streptomyces sp. YIM 130001]|uniref:SDR family oxidoreductase n=1 Tax=Streptomyces sp. YIM 130001 TaxID=2259644 RepID=UPI000ED15FE1|nr:SDR family oxidoreductase [Streptomyces sp. YIM 130001]RII08120.1 3-oxoacyl-[acyl-carrier-protein] reductase FabG [Streptomyces sp. YIM 130001]
MNGMDGKVALVTGGSRGMGAAIALRLAGEGADVAITYVSNRADAEEVVTKVEAAGRRGVAIRSDAADAEAAAGVVDRVVEHFGRLDILVNNAGIAMLGPMTGLSGGDVNRVLDTNVRGVFLTTQAAAGRLEHGGRIISTGTALARYAGGPGGTLYALSKSALTGMTKALARELGERAVTVNLIHPGPVDTAMNPADGPFAESQRTATALGRFGTADEVASLVAYLAGDDAAYITGAELVVDGGHSA